MRQKIDKMSLEPLIVPASKALLKEHHKDCGISGESRPTERAPNGQ